MKPSTTILILAFLMPLSCTNKTKTANDASQAAPDTGAKGTVLQMATQGRNQGEYTLPIHGALSQEQIDRFYPKMTDTLKNRRTIGADRVEIKSSKGIYVSMLHNTSTSDQLFLCTHDSTFTLIDAYYIGIGTGFDKTSHAIEYNIIGDDQLEFHHVDWGYVKRGNKSEIDTLKYRKYILTITKAGKIVQKY